MAQSILTIRPAKSGAVCLVGSTGSALLRPKVSGDNDSLSRVRSNTCSPAGYEFVCALGAVTSVDGMVADFYHYDMNFLGQAATRIINEVRGINRVVYDVTSKPPGTIEWE